MGRPALPEERGHDEPHTQLSLDELRRTHDWESETYDCYEEGDELGELLVCRQCGHERPLTRRGRAPDCPARELPCERSSEVQ